MEESRRDKGSLSRPKHLLTLLSKQPKQYQPLQAQTLSKMNQWYPSHGYSFSSQVKRVSKKGLPAFRENRLCPPPLLTKNSNKIQQNILKHRNLDWRNSPSRKYKGEKKTQLIINRPYYLQYFKPKTYEEIVDHQKSEPLDQSLCSHFPHKQSFSSLYTSSSDLRQQRNSQLQPMRQTYSCNKRKRIEGSKLLASTMGSFMQLEEIPQKQFNKQISLYCMRQLECYYRSLLKFSQGCPQKYKEGLESMLNLMDVSSNQKVLSRQLLRFQQNPTFPEFLQIYSKVIDANLRQNVMDFFDIIFEECGMKELNRQQLMALLSQRMSKPDAGEIVEEVLFHLEPDVKVVTTSDIFTLCVANDEFCIFMKKFTLSDGKKK